MTSVGRRGNSVIVPIVAYTDLILTRDLKSPAPLAEWPAGLRCLAVGSTADTGYAQLDAFCATNHFPPNWVAEMLNGGRSAWVVVAQDNATNQEVVAAGGWMVRGPFYVEEMDRTFDSGPDGVYLFGDFVGEAWRGRGLQRQLVRERLQSAASSGARWAYSMTRDNNPASMKSYAHEGFITSAEIHVQLKGPLRLDRFRRRVKNLPAGSLSAAGMWLPLGYRLRRRGRR
jgi:GNAT superfamily N-acetyltransferase